MVKYERDYKRQDVVNIAGEVNYPGYYTIETGKTKIGDILAKAGGYTDKADKTKLFISLGIFGFCSIFVSIIQYFVEINSLALIFPWRSSVFLMPFPIR